MEITRNLYVTAVVADRAEAAHAPYVATPLGPFAETEKTAIEDAESWLRLTYGTTDIRVVRPEGAAHDFDTARNMVLMTVAQEVNASRLAREEAQARAAIASVSERFALSEVDDLDRILELLGVNPGDV